MLRKKGKIKRCLVAESKSVNPSFLLNFIDEILAKTIHHRNLLSNFRSAYPKVLQSLSTTEFNIDFSENLTLVLPQEIQSMHWGQAKTNVTVHFKKRRFQAIPSIHLSSSHPWPVFCLCSHNGNAFWRRDSTWINFHNNGGEIAVVNINQQNIFII